MKISNNITQDYLLKLLGLQSLAPMYLDKYNDFLLYLANAPEEFMGDSELDAICSLLKIEDDVRLSLHNALNIINNSYEAKLACYYYKYLSYIAFYSTANQIFSPVSTYALDDYIFHSFIILAPIKWRYDEAIKRGIPHEYMVEQLHDVSVHVMRWMRNKKSPNVIRWNTIVSYLELFPIDTLTLEPFFNNTSWHGFKNGNGEKIILMQEGRKIRTDGQLDGVNGIYDYSFTTSFSEDDNYYYGNPVDPYGIVLKEIVKLPKSEWTPFPKRDDWFLEFHVSSANPYTIETFKSSILKGIEFFKKYYPERSFVAVRGYSWLFSPQLKYILDENKGNISRIKGCGYTLPTMAGEENVFNFVFHNTTIKPEDIPETTSLYKGIKKYLLSGGRINCGEIFFFLEDIDKMMDSFYLKSFPSIINKLKK